MINTLAVLMPSRGRPHNVQRVLDDLTATQSTATLILICDQDDPGLGEYLALKTHPYWPNVRVFIHPPATRGMVAPINTTFHHIIDHYQHFAFLGDDVRIRTARWDEQVVNALNAIGTGVVYWDDLHYGQELCTHWAITGDIARTWGYFAPPTLRHLYVDNFFMALGRDLNSLHYLPNVVIEHLHPGWLKNSWDALYLQVNDEDNYTHDKAAFDAFLQSGEYAQLITKLTKGRNSD